MSFEIKQIKDGCRQIKNLCMGPPLAPNLLTTKSKIQIPFIIIVKNWNFFCVIYLCEFKLESGWKLIFRFIKFETSIFQKFPKATTYNVTQSETIAQC